MITLEGTVVLADITQMVQDLKFDLELQGIKLFPVVKDSDSSKNVMVSCPFHKDGQEHRPSCGIAKTEVYRNGNTYPPGTVFCFTCGYASDFFTFVTRCWGTTEVDFGKRYILKKYNTMEMHERPEIKLHLERKPSGQLPYKYIDESILNNYRYTSDYLIQRQFELDTILFYEYGLNLQNNTITMPVRDHKGGLVFVKQRFINPPLGGDKYLNQPGISKQYILYGFYQVLQLITAINNGTCINKKLKENYKRLGIILTEGEFNASYLMQSGYPAVSLLGRILFEDTTHRYIQQKELLLRYGIKKLCLWMDLDKSGQEAQSTIYMQTYKQFRLTQPDYSQFSELNDANDHSLEQLDRLSFVRF